MKRPLAIIAAICSALITTSAAAQNGAPISTGSADQLTLAVFGDWPYSSDLLEAAPLLLESINSDSKVRLVMHVGDIHSGSMPCTGAGVPPPPYPVGVSPAPNPAWNLGIYDIFEAFKDPVVYTPGDNEWTDCGRAYWARRDPLERLAKLRQLFFTRDASLGQRTLRAERQHARGYPEHMRWRVDDIVFATLNIPGPDNNVRLMAEESRQRTAALIDWMRDTFRIARSRALPGIVLATQANIWSGSSGYARILETLAAEAQSYPGEVLVIHGDTHWFRMDRPLVDPETRRTIENVTRLEVYGSPFVDWVHVSVRTEGRKARFEVVPGSRIAVKERP